MNTTFTTSWKRAFILHFQRWEGAYRSDVNYKKCAFYFPSAIFVDISQEKGGGKYK